MFFDFSKLQVYVRPGPTDMRKRSVGLSILVQESLGMDPFSGSLFMFCNRRKNILKILYWDRNGFAVWSKRLEAERFPWPKDRKSVAAITAAELEGLLSGIDYFCIHKEMTFSRV